MKVLFVHFPFNNDEVEGKELPKYFASRGHEVHSIFRKDVRKFTSKYYQNGIIEQIPEECLLTNYDLLVCKSSSYQTYGKNFLGSKTFVVNITPMGLSNNLKNIDYAFDISQLIKPPVQEMRDALTDYLPWEKRKNQIVIAASIGSDKNQIEFVKFFDPKAFPDYSILFLGTIVSQNYANDLISILKNKKVNFSFDNVDRKTLGKIFMESKFSALTTDPRPGQPYDPSPRVVFESISAGTPCILSDLVRVHEGSKQFSFFYENQNLKSFESMTKRVMESDLSKISRESYDYGIREYNLENACKKAYEDIIKAMNAI